MSSAVPLAVEMEHVVKQFANHSIFNLKSNEDFLNAIRAAGKNKSLNIVRRWSFMRAKPTLKVSDDKRIVNINMDYGYNASTTLYTIERQVIIPELDKNVEQGKECLTLYIPDENATMASLEDEINGFAETQGWTFEEGVRKLPIKYFLSPESPYAFEMKIIIDTLSTYAEFKLNVIMNFMDINDAILQLNKAHKKRTGETLPDAFDLRLGCKTELEYAERYKEHVKRR